MTSVLEKMLNLMKLYQIWNYVLVLGEITRYGIDRQQNMFSINKIDP